MATIRKEYNPSGDISRNLSDILRKNGMEAHLREERDARGYTTREPDSYWNSRVARWRMDAKDWSRHKDDVMMYALTVMNEVKAGTRPPPTVEEFKSGLPKVKWTEK